MTFRSAFHVHWLRLVAGILLLPTLAAAQVIPAPPRWPITRDLVIGSGASADEYQFSRILSLVPTMDNSVIVGEGRDQPLRIFTPAGRLSHQVGRAGRGPGEFAGLRDVGVLGDTIWTTDVNLRRTTLFRTNGSVVTTKPWDAVASVPGAKVSVPVFVSGVFPDGSAWGSTDLPPEAFGGPELPRAILRVGPSVKGWDTLAVVPTSHTMLSTNVGGSITFGPHPFQDAPLVIGAEQASRLYLVERAASSQKSRGTFRVIAIRSNGDTMWTRSIEYAPRALDQSVRDSVLRAVLRRARRSPETEQELRRKIFLPPFRPPVAGGFTAADGTLWLRREPGEAETEYWAILPDGRVGGRIIVPSGVSLMAARGTYVWGVEKDADDVPTIVRFRVTRP